MRVSFSYHTHNFSFGGLLLRLSPHNPFAGSEVVRENFIFDFVLRGISRLVRMTVTIRFLSSYFETLSQRNDQLNDGRADSRTASLFTKDVGLCSDAR